MDYRSKPILFLSRLGMKLRRLALVKWLSHSLWGRSYRTVITWSTLVCLIAAVSVGGVALYTKLTGGNKADQHLAELQRAVAEDDLEAAAVALEQLVQLQPDNKRYSLRLALADHQRGRTEQAQVRMEKLVQEQDPQAALWMVENNYTHSGYQSWDDEQRAEFRSLLQLAVQAPEERDFVRAKHLLATYLLELGEWSEAVDHLEDLSRFKPEARLHAASVCELHGDSSRAKQYARISQIHFNNKLEEQPRDITARLNLARSLIVLEQEQVALTLLAEGFELTQQATLQKAAGEILVSWAKRLARDNPSQTLTDRAQLIHRATQCAPADTAVVKSLLQLINECGLDSDANIAHFQRAAAMGGDHESLHFMLGVLLLDRADWNAATQHFKLAEQAGSHLPTILNNLAIAVLQNDGADRALLYANAANELLPNQPNLCEVRGRILVQLQRYEEAIPDLQVGMQADELKSLAIPNLLVAYRATGQEDEARNLEALKLDASTKP